VSASRDAVVAAARVEFGHHGYNGTQIEQIARRAGVTVDTLYGHFKTKRLVFDAVFQQVHMELVTASSHAAAQVEKPLDMFVAAFDAYLDAMLDPSVQRIAMIDGAEVLGFARFNELDEKFTLGALSATLELLTDDGRLHVDDAENVARLLLGAVARGAMHIARSPDPKRARAEVGAALLEVAKGIIPPEG
jgi:AcrR family transcriptional regulator